MKTANFKKCQFTILSAFTFLIVILIYQNSVFAQPPEFSWAKRAGGTNSEFTYGIGRDHGTSNILTTGIFYGSASFGSTNLSSVGSSDIFISKLDASGNFLWAKQAGGSGIDYGRSVTTDVQNNVIATGYFSGTASFGTLPLTSNGNYDIFLAKYDPSGNILWVIQAGGTGLDYGYSVETDESNNIFVTGHFSGSANFGNITLTSQGSYDVFLAKYNSLGNLLWIRQFGGTNNDYGYSIATDKSGNAIVAGAFYGSATFGPYSLTSTGGPDIFITKCDALGNVSWARRAGSSSYDYAFGIETDWPNSNIFVTGRFSGSASFSGITMSSAGNYDIFVAKYDPSGAIQWAKQAGGTNNEESRSITTDRAGGCLITGFFNGSASFGGTTLTSLGSSDIFVASYDASGNFIWVKQAGGSSNDESYGITMDLTSNFVIAGHFNGSATFGSTTLYSSGGSDVFIAKLMDTPSWINVTDPNGGEIWYVGSSYEIKWTSDKYSGLAEVALSKDGGSSWINLTDPYYTDNDGSYSFIPQASHVSSNCLIKVTSVENVTVSDQSDYIFTIFNPDQKKRYLAVQIPTGASVPVIDGNLNDTAWSYANGPELLGFGGVPSDFLAIWNNFSDNKVEWKALWSPVSNRLYIAITIQDDKAGTIDNDYDHIWQDDGLEIYTDGDISGGDYSNNYAIAQQWQIRRDNAKHLEFLPGLYTGTAITSAVSYGSGGNWIIEMSMIIYNNYPSNIKQLTLNEVIGWEVWYNDSDNETYENGSWVRDHQVGWAYAGPAYYNADFFQELELGPSIPLTPYIAVTVPNGGEIWNENTSYELKWASQNTNGSVAIYYSLDGGVTWRQPPIYPSTADDGSASWITPDVSADITTCRIKVQDASNSNIWDMSDNNFTIKNIPPETITVIQPNGSEKWQIGSIQTIKWTTNGASNNVKIELTRNGGSSWEPLYISTTNDGVENWTVTGPPSNLCKIKITDVDGTPSDQSDGYFEITPPITPQHFTPVWTGNPFQPMTIYCTQAILYGDGLVAGDEIGIFDGNKCVGTKALTQTPTPQNPVEIICSKDDGTGNGFAEGKPIIFKVWDQSGAAEYNAKSQFIDLQTGAPISPVPFTALGTAAAQLTAPGRVTQSIPLNAGWNIFSLAVTPEGDPDMLKVLAMLLDNSLVKVIDEQGHSIVKLFDRWINSIGNWQPTEGYYINVSQQVTLQVTGMEIATPLAIPLNAGWNIISYPCYTVSQDAKTVVQPLIDSGYLVKVIDEQGFSIIKIFGNWNNSISNMKPGEGYLVNVNTNCTLSLKCGNAMLAAKEIASPPIPAPNHFQRSQSGNPFEPMNIFVVDARVDGQPLAIGDEIAVYDGDQLVGVSALNSFVSITNPLEIIASKDDGSGTGFLDGQTIRYQVWRSSSETYELNDAQVQFFDPTSGDLIEAQPFEAYGTAVAAISVTTTSASQQEMIPQSYALRQNHPNPFNPTTRICYELPEATDVDVVIFDLQGNLVKRLFNGRQNAGRYEMEWDGRNNQGIRVVSGIYFYRLTTAKFSATHKMILAK